MRKYRSETLAGGDRQGDTAGEGKVRHGDADVLRKTKHKGGNLEDWRVGDKAEISDIAEK
jgi:hypothetical protein